MPGPMPHAFVSRASTSEVCTSPLSRREPLSTPSLRHGALTRKLSRSVLALMHESCCITAGQHSLIVSSWQSRLTIFINPLASLWSVIESFSYGLSPNDTSSRVSRRSKFDKATGAATAPSFPPCRYHPVIIWLPLRLPSHPSSLHGYGPLYLGMAGTYEERTSGQQESHFQVRVTTTHSV